MDTDGQTAYVNKNELEKNRTGFRTRTHTHTCHTLTCHDLSQCTEVDRGSKRSVRSMRGGFIFRNHESGARCEAGLSACQLGNGSTKQKSGVN